MKRFGPILLAVLATAVVHAQTHTVVTYEGAWSSTPTYVKNAVVTEAGSTYVSVQSNINHDPAADTGHTWWAPLPGGTTFNGGTVANPITLPADPTANLQAATKQYVDAHTSPVTINGKTGTNLALAASDVNAASASQAGSPFATVANNLISQNHHLFSDNTDGWCAGSVYCSYGEYGADILYTMTLYPGHFTSTQVLNTVSKFVNAKNANGDFPATVNWDGTPDFYCTPSYDLHCSHATGDGWMAVTQLTYLYWQKTGDLTPYTANVAAVKTALARIPRNSTNHLITVTPGDEYVACSGFREQGRFTGDDACASVNYAIAAKEWAAMATAAGDATNASFFTTEYTNVKASIASVLTDSGTQMLNGATIQNNQIDIMSTVQAVYNELLPSAQESAISDWLNTNYSSVTHNGFVLEMAAPCSYWGHIPSSGGPPYDQSGGFNPSNSSYQCGGSWGFLSGWFAYALAKNHPAQAATFVASYLSNTTPGTEYFTGSSANGDPALLTAAQGQRNASELYDPGYTAPSTVLCALSPLGSCITSIASDGANGAGVPDLTLPWVPNISITQTTPTFFSIQGHFAPNMSTGSHMLLPLGIGSSPNNESYVGFVNVGGAGSPSNYGTLGMYGADDAMTWWADGSVRFAQPRLISAVLTCSASLGGQFNYVHANSSTKDVLQVCAQDAGGTYAWRSLY